jgi:DNA-binding transcriptional regulator YbjK
LACLLPVRLQFTPASLLGFELCGVPFFLVVLEIKYIILYQKTRLNHLKRAQLTTACQALEARLEYRILKHTPVFLFAVVVIVVVVVVVYWFVWLQGATSKTTPLL